MSRLIEQKVEYSEIFTNDAVELAARKADLIARVRALKQTEGDSPPTGWDMAIESTFACY